MRRIIWTLVIIVLVLSVPFLYMVIQGNREEALRYEQQLHQKYAEALPGCEVLGVFQRTSNATRERFDWVCLGWASKWDALVYAQRGGMHWFIYLDNKNPVAWVEAKQFGQIGPQP
jgi:hypothetical protein